MENKENLVTETVAENVEQTTEQSPKTYTEAEFNAKLDEVLGKKIARREAKIRKEYEGRYGRLEEVLKAGTGKQDVGEITNGLEAFYRSKGKQIPEKANYSEKDIEVLARAEAEDIIGGGYDEVVEEVDRLAAMGIGNMTARDKAVFKVLAEHRQNAERNKELAEIGVTEDVYNSKEFKDIQSMCNSDTPIKKVYELYLKTQPKKEIRTMGSMKNSTTDDGTVKDYYTFDEAQQFTKKDFDKNPALFKAVQESMQKW